MENTKMYNIGIERESLRCNKNGELSKTAHPEIFWDRMENAFITTDFGEAQLELRTPVCNTTKECYEKIENITDVVLNELNSRNELLWPYSMPCILPREEDFVFGNYGNQEEHEYEMFLYKKYGYKMHCMSGIHINFSINKDFYEKIRVNNPKLPENMDDAYFLIMKNFLKLAWVPIYFLGCTPIQYENNEKSEISLRNTQKQGFSTRRNLEIDFSNKKAYIQSIRNEIKNGTILNAKEAYIPIRAKSKSKNNVLDELENGEVDHIEVRLCDLNAFDKCGISKADLDFVIAFLFYCLICNNECDINYQEVAENGLNEEQQKQLLTIIKQLEKLNAEYKLDCDDGINELNEVYRTKETKAEKIKRLVQESDIVTVNLELAEKHMQDALEHKYCIPQYMKLQPSTIALIKDAITAGIDYEIINEEKNFIMLKNKDHKEYVVEATKTRLDSYIFPYITDDKIFAKEIIKSNNLNVPYGDVINKDMEEVETNLIKEKYCGKAMVVKPRNTNCGNGITVFDEPATREEIEKAIEYAFIFDRDIILEEYVKGKEYRFLVIDGKCNNVVWRRSASVVGDGVSTIKELIKAKDEEEWHKLLWHPMKIEQPVKMFLEKQGLSFESIPNKDERVFIRENSNCSTGGETVIVTNDIPEYFKRISEQVARLFNAKICGVDIIIENIQEKKYKIIEINDNPGIGIIQWPYEGKGERIGLEILKLLEFLK